MAIANTAAPMMTITPITTKTPIIHSAIPVSIMQTVIVSELRNNNKHDGRILTS